MPDPSAGRFYGSENPPVYAVIMAGGLGTRLWPLSREALPKQFLALQPGGSTLLQEAVRRSVAVAGTLEKVLVVVQAEHESLVAQQLPELPAENLILEPFSRNTAACLGLAALHIQRRSPQAIMAVFPADHLYEVEKPWLDAVRSAIAFASRAKFLVTIGIEPASPSSRYGYIHLGQLLEQPANRESCCPVYEGIEFIEKPEAARARSFLESGEFLWNTGTFAWQVSVFQNALKHSLPKLFKDITDLMDVIESWEAISSAYARMESISVDVGILENASQVAVVRGDFRRIDVGSLASLAEIWVKDPEGNASQGEVISRDSQDNIIYTDDGLVGLIGLQDMIVVRHGDVVLVCPKSRSSEARELVAAIKQKGLHQYL